MYSSHRQYRIPIWECLRFDPATLKQNTNMFTPITVYKSTLLPKQKTNVEIEIPWVNEPRIVKPTPSKGWVR